MKEKQKSRAEEPKLRKPVKFDMSVKSDTGRLEHKLIPYIPSSELIFPPALWKFEKTPICFFISKKIWISPTTLNQLIAIKDLSLLSKLIGGATEIQIEVRFKNSQFVVCFTFTNSKSSVICMFLNRKRSWHP